MAGRGRGWLLLPAGISLLVGIDAGLILLQAPAPLPMARLAEVHGPLMVLGFLGTLIALERAVALQAPWGYLAPVLLGLAGLSLIAGIPLAATILLALQGLGTLIAVLFALWQRRHDDAVLAQAFGACLALLATVVLSRVEIAAVVPLLGAFIVVTIAAERIELSVLGRPAGATSMLLTMALIVGGAATSTLVEPRVGSRLFGAALLGLVAWLAPRDVAVRLARSVGLPRYSAVAMLAGYLWLAVAGGAWLVSGVTTDPGVYDVQVHAVFLGFAMSMVLAHAPVILPGVLGRAIPYRGAFWIPLLALHASLLLRVAGDLAAAPGVQVAGGVGTA
ncbi:MAG: hypothetical protein ACK5KO_02260, partial [Arachnia sp.]